MYVRVKSSYNEKQMQIERIMRGESNSASKMQSSRDDYFRFGSVFIKKK